MSDCMLSTEDEGKEWRRAEKIFGSPRPVGGCKPGFGPHDYSRPPHNTPDTARPIESVDLCQARSADAPFGRCAQARTYEVVIYSIGTHDWVKMYACIPCTASLRRRHANLGPSGSQGIYEIAEVGNG